jgi:hypothetical protein
MSTRMPRKIGITPPRFKAKVDLSHSSTNHCFYVEVMIFFSKRATSGSYDTTTCEELPIDCRLSGEDRVRAYC